MRILQPIREQFPELWSNNPEVVALALGQIQDPISRKDAQAFIDAWPEFPILTQTMLLPIFGTTRCAVLYRWMLDYYVSTDAEDVEISCFAILSTTDFPIFPYIIELLRRPVLNEGRLVRLLHRIPISRVQPFLDILGPVRSMPVLEAVYGPARTSLGQSAD